MEVFGGLDLLVPKIFARMSHETYGIFKGFFKKVQIITAKSLGKTLSRWDKHAKRTKKQKKKVAKGIGTALDVLGVMLQFLDKIGALQPILEILNGIFSMIGGAVMEVLAPALAEFAKEMFDEEHMQMWKDLGYVIGQIVVLGLKAFVVLINALAPTLIILAPVLLVLIKLFGILLSLAFLPLMTIIYVLGWVILGFVDSIMAIISFITLGAVKPTNFRDEWSDMMLPAIGALVMGAINIAALGTGGYVSPTTGGTIIRAGEGREGEFVIPESKMGSIGGGEEMLWATQDNGEKLDRIAFLLKSQGRLI